MYNLCFYDVWRGFRTISVGFSFSVLLPISGAYHIYCLVMLPAPKGAWATCDNVRGQISVHIFAPNGGCCLFTQRYIHKQVKINDMNRSHLSDYCLSLITKVNVHFPQVVFFFFFLSISSYGYSSILFLDENDVQDEREIYGGGGDEMITECPVCHCCD